jgi:hypothetical protein
MTSKTTLFTIGHSAHPLDGFRVLPPGTASGPGRRPPFPRLVACAGSNASISLLFSPLFLRDKRGPLTGCRLQGGTSVQRLHNRVRAYLDGLPMPQVYRSQLQAICELQELVAARQVELVTIWRGDEKPPDPKPTVEN